MVPDGAADPAATPPQTARLLNLPNALTVFRLAVVPLFAALLLSDGGMDDDRRIWATVFFALAIITDRYDGLIARRTGQVLPATVVDTEGVDLLAEALVPALAVPAGS